MENQNIEQNLWYRGLKIIMYALLATPLLFLSIFLFPFITTKILYLRILIEIALAIYLFLAFRYPEIRPSWNWLTRGVWIYMGVITLASLFGVNIGTSFMGTIERGEGVVTMLHFAIYFTMLPVVFRNGKDWYRYLMSTNAVIAIIGIYGMLQLTGATFVIGSQGSRISGTIGNAAFFAAVMLFGVFLSVYLWMHPRTQKIWQKTFLGLSTLIVLVAMYLSQTRGALVALAVSLVLFSLFSLWRARGKKTKLAAGLLLIAIVLGGLGIYFGKDSSFIQNQTTLRRLSTISFNDITTQSRLDTWNASWQGWQDRFFLGYGYENYNVAFNKYFPARIFKDQGSQVWFDRAHNIFFDVAVTSGIVGLLSYLSIFILAFWSLRKVYKKFRATESGPNWQMPLVLGLALIAYFIQNLFVFDTQATYLIFFLLLAYISHLSDQTNQSGETEKSKRVFRPGFGVGIVLTVLTLMSVYFVNIEPAFANYYTVRGIYAAATKDYRQVQPIFEKALSYGTYMDEEIRQRLVDYANEAVASGQLSPQEQAEMYAFTIRELQKSIDSSPRDVKNYLYMLTVFNRAERFDESYLDRGLQMVDRALQLSPTRPQIYFEIGQIYFSKGDIDAALEQFKKAVDLNPQPKESHINYALAGILGGREEIAAEQIRVVTEDLGYELTADDHANLARAYRAAGEYDLSVAQLMIAADKNPENTVNYYITIAQTYAQGCQIESMRQILDQLVEMNPSLSADAQSFLSETTQSCSTQ